MSPGGYPSPENTSGGGHGPYHGHNGYQSTTEQSDGTLMEVLRATQAVPPNGVQQSPIPSAELNGHPGSSNSPGQLPGSPSQHIFDANAPHLDEHGQIIQYNHYQPNDPNADSARKRSKVSRACDECRRKKIRCDANPDGGPEACSSCKRTNQSCRFSRQPMKRGPSKGYIKELADRLGELESRVGGPSAAALPYTPAGVLEAIGQDYPLGELTPASRKRTHSTSEGFSGAYPVSSAADATSGAQPQNPWSDNDVSFHQGGDGSLAYWDDPTSKEAYRLYQDLLPFLPYRIERLYENLGRVPRDLQELFAISMNLAVRSNPTTAPPFHDMNNAQNNAIRAARLVSGYEEHTDGNTRLPPIANSIVFLESLIFLTLFAINERHRSISWLDRAVGYANAVQLYRVPDMEWLREEGDWDTDQKLPRRILQSLFILDRWHSVSTSSPGRITAQACPRLPEDMKYMTPDAWHLIRVTSVMNDIMDLLINSNAPHTQVEDKFNSMTKENPFVDKVRRIIEGKTDLIAESLTSVTNPQVSLACQHARLLIVSLDPTSSLQERHAQATRLVESFTEAIPSFSVFGYHFAALAAVILAELLSDDNHKADAARQLDELDVALSRIRTVPPEASHLGWDVLVREFIAKKRAPDASVGALENLAAAAVTGSANGDGVVAAAGSDGVDVADVVLRMHMAAGSDPLVTSGYLVVLKQQLGR